MQLKPQVSHSVYPLYPLSWSKKSLFLVVESIRVRSRTYPLWIAGTSSTVSQLSCPVDYPQLIWGSKRDFLCTARVGQPHHPPLVPLRLSRSVLPKSWHTMIVCSAFSHMGCLHRASSGSLGNCVLSRSLQITSNMAISLRYWIPLSTLIHLPVLHISLEGIPSVYAWYESCPETEGLCPFSNRFVNTSFPRKGSQLLPSLPSHSRLLGLLSQHWSSQVTLCLPRQRQKSFCVSHSSPMDSEQVVTILLSSSSSSCDGPAFSSSLTKQADFCFQAFFSCIGVTDTGTDWSSGSSAVPVTGFWVTAVPVTEDWVAAGACHRVWSNCCTCHIVRDTLFPLRVLNSVKQGSVVMGQAPAHCSDLCLSGTARMTAHFF